MERPKELNKRITTEPGKKVGMGYRREAWRERVAVYYCAVSTLEYSTQCS